MKLHLKEQAIVLRKNGFTYAQILEQVPVAKSTLSLWLRSIQLVKKQKYIMTEKRLAAVKRGWETSRKKRIDKTNAIQQTAILEIKEINALDLLTLGTMLDWAEGTKQRTHNISQGICFSNSDPKMIKLFLKWLLECLKISSDDIYFNIYVHENHRSNTYSLVDYWAGVTRFPQAKFDRIYFKKHKVASNRKNKGETYHGLLRIAVKEVQI